MNKIHSLFALLLLIIQSACTDRIETPNMGIDSDVPEGMVRLRINTTIEGESVVVTRSTTPDATESALTGTHYVLVFDKAADGSDDPQLTQPPAIATWDANGGGTGVGRLKVDLFQDGTERYICVLANVSPTHFVWLESQDAGTQYSTYSKIRARLTNILPTTNVKISKPLPLSGWAETATKLEVSTTSTPPTQLTPSVHLTRSVARIDVSGTDADFTIYGAGVANCPRTGYHLPAADNSVHVWDATTMTQCDIIPNTSNTTEYKALLYTNEHGGGINSANELPLRVVVMGQPATGATSPTYYGIDIVYPDPLDATKRSMKVERNFNYTIKFKNVSKGGYATYEEAARASAFNNDLGVEIIVTDPYAHDITTNGRQYLGVTNTEYVLYPFPLPTNVIEPISTNLHVVSFTYTCDPTWSSGTITLTEGLSLPSSISPQLAVSNNAVQRDLLVNMSSKFTSGKIILHIGNLRKEIKVRRMNPTSSGGNVLSNYYEGAPQKDSEKAPEFREYKIGEVINFSDATSWLKVATTDDVSGEAALSNRVVTGQGGIFVHVAHNFSYDAGGTSAPTAPREASIYLSGDAQGERIRVHVQQSAADIYTGTAQIKPFSYVSAFWRANQTGERIIRMYASMDAREYNTPIRTLNSNWGNPKSIAYLWWQADVVAGREWIVLDDGPSKDPNVKKYTGTNTPNPYGIGDNGVTGDAVEAYQIDSKKRSVGYVGDIDKGSENYIFFRIGLTGKLGGPAATPRYGLVIISYGTAPGKIDGYHPIYIRQGEAADYVMRPFDPIPINPRWTNNWRYPSRPAAARISPFNLTVENNHGRDEYITINPYEGVFAEFPSQTGCFFQGNAINQKLYCYPATAKSAIIQNVRSGTTWLDEDKACPKGYRRINDGNNQVENKIGPIIGSEIRQSFFLFPPQGGKQALEDIKEYPIDLSNQYIGYIADGFFDRQPIESAYSYMGVTREDNSVVNYSSVQPYQVQEAMRGALYFNPFNYASVFLPLSGRYGKGAGTTPGTLGKGSNTTLNTATSYNDTQLWEMVVGNRLTSAFDNDNNSSIYSAMYFSTKTPAYSARCVRDDTPIIETGGEIGNSGSGTTINGIDRDTDPNNNSTIAARITYTSGTSLQEQIEANYRDKLHRIGSLAISGSNPLTTADWTYLNSLADNSSYQLHHLIIRTTSPFTTIPEKAFTSARWYTINLRGDVNTIANNAFTSNLSSLREVGIQWYEEMKATSGDAFSFNTTGVSIELGNAEYSLANKETKEWKGKTWSSIKKNID